MNWLLIVATVVSLLGGSGLVVGADAAVPGDTLYGLDLALEDLRVENAADPARALKLQLAFAKERLREAEKLVNRGDMANYQQAVAAYDAALFAAGQVLVAADMADANQLDEILNAGFAAHEELLSQLDQDDDPDNDSPADASWCVGEKQHPVGLRLAERYDVPYEEIVAWACSGAGFGEISLAYNISTLAEVSVEELFALRAEGLGWGEIKQAYGLIGGPGDGDDDGDEKGEDDGNYCAGEGEHPQGLRLAETCGVGYEEIMSWFCGGAGFGDIGHAYDISLQAGVSVEDLFAMRAAGLDWGEIKQECGLNCGSQSNNGNGPPDDAHHGHGPKDKEDKQTGPRHDVPPGQVGKEKPPKDKD